MGIADSLGCVRVSRYRPRIKIRISGMCGVSPTGEEETLLYLARVGEAEGEFAAYAPIERSGEYLTFQFDELLFVKKSGRYTGRLVVDGNDCTTIRLQYENNNCGVVSVESTGEGCGTC